MKTLLSTTVFALSIFASAPVAADVDDVELDLSVAPEIDLRTMAGDIDGYYEGELISTYIVTGLGLAAIGTGIGLVLQDDDFARGLGWPLLILGALQSVGALVYAFEVGSQRDHYGAALDRDPGAFRDEESEHMAGTIDRFVFYQIAELALTLGGAGIATYGFVAEEDVWKGIGIGVAALALPFLIIDLVNQQRGAEYADRVGRTAVPASPSATATPRWGDSFDRLAGSAAVSDGFYFSVTRSF